MIKLLLSGFWACAVTLVAAYMAISWQSSHAQEETAPDKFFGGLEYVRARQLSVPIIADGTIQGYVVAQFVFTIEAKLLRRLSVKPDVFLTDEAFKAIYAGEGIDFRKLKKQDLPALTKLVADNVNRRFGARFVEEVLIEDLKYVPRDNARGGARL